MNRRVGVLLNASLLVAGCDAEGPPTLAPLVVDSADIRIVTHLSPPTAVGSLGDSVLLRVGAGPDITTPLYRVRGGILRPDGAIVLANAGSYEILYFSPRGEVLRRVGRQGDGPGEFRAVSWLQARVDGGVNVSDALSRRVTALSPDGELVWSRSFDPSPQSSSDPKAMMVRGIVLSSTDAGSFLAYPTAFAFPDGEPGLLPVVGALRRYDPERLTYEDRGELTVITWYEDPSADGPPLGDMLGGTRIWYSGHSGRMAYTESASYEIDVLDGGDRTLRIREVRPLIPLEPDSVRASVVFVADSMPAYQDIRVDSEHRVWARASTDPDHTEWRVFGVDGAAVGTLTLPEDAVVLDSDDSRVLLLRHDELDVESVELWDLIWSAPHGHP